MDHFTDNQNSPVSPLHRLPSARLDRPTPPPADRYLPAKARYHSRRHRLIRSLSLFAVTFFLSFGMLNGSTYTSRIGYWWKTDIRGEDPVEREDLERLTGGLSVVTQTSQNSETPSPPPTQAENWRRLPVVPVSLPANYLIIPKIGVNAPVVWEADPSSILTDLQKGIAHYRGTSRPNTENGNVFLTGHSSNYVWDFSPYNKIFANLDKLVAGDIVALTTDSHEYIYQVTDQIVVRPQETSVLGFSSTPILSLMTCTPVGTNLRRLVVRANLVRVLPLSP